MVRATKLVKFLLIKYILRSLTAALRCIWSIAALKLKVSSMINPKYENDLTHSKDFLPIRRLPHTIVLSILCLLPTKSALVFDTLMDRLLQTDHWYILSRSSWILETKVGKSSPERNKTTSSAYRRSWAFRSRHVISFKNKLNWVGPRTEPCGTP